MMSDRWTDWTSFPRSSYDGGDVRAQAGCGVYEICNAASREQLAFGCTRNVAGALRNILKPSGLRAWLSFRRVPRFAIGEVEYRVWPTATFSDAKALITVIRGQRGAVLRRFTTARI